MWLGGTPGRAVDLPRAAAAATRPCPCISTNPLACCSLHPARHSGWEVQGDRTRSPWSHPVGCRVPHPPVGLAGASVAGAGMQHPLHKWVCAALINVTKPHPEH